jgi:hypothetical protein
MTSDAAAEQDRQGYLAHPETADPSGVADQLSAEAWTDLDCLTSSSVRPVATQPGSSGLQAE